MKYIFFILLFLHLTEKQDIYIMSPVTWSNPPEIQNVNYFEINFKGIDNEKVCGKKRNH